MHLVPVATQKPVGSAPVADGGEDGTDGSVSVDCATQNLPQPIEGLETQFEFAEQHPRYCTKGNPGAP